MDHVTVVDGADGPRYPQLHDPGWMKVKHQAEGLTPNQLAALIGCSEGAARNALVRLGVYRPTRRPHEGRVLAHVGEERMLADAATVSSWWALARLYNVQVVVVQDHALFLDIFNEVPTRFDPSSRGTKRGPDANAYLQSRDWIAVTFGQTHAIGMLAERAGVHVRTVYRWLSYHRMTVDQLREGRNRAIVLEYQQGFSLRELSVRFELDPAGVYRILAAAGVPTGRRRLN